jgi:L-asparagine transporter-like permease
MAKRNVRRRAGRRGRSREPVMCDYCCNYRNETLVIAFLAFTLGVVFFRPDMAFGMIAGLLVVLVVYKLFVARGKGAPRECK